MTFPCLVCGDLPIVDQPTPQVSCSGGGNNGVSSGARISTGSGSYSSPAGGGAGSSKKSGGGATIRTLSKDVSDKIFQNLCRHLYVKPEPYWFIQNPGEQMPLCAFCSGVVLEIYTLQTKMDQFQAMIKKLVLKLERIVADTEIAGNWMATREEQEGEEDMWNNIPCPPMAIRIARERHHKFRQQILNNFKTKVKVWRKMRTSGQQQQSDDLHEMEPIFATLSSAESHLENVDERKIDNSSFLAFTQNHTTPKRARLDETVTQNQTLPGLIRAQRNQSPMPVRSSPSALSSTGTGVSNNGVSTTNFSRLSQQQSSSQQIKIPSTISVSAVGSTIRGNGGGGGEQSQEQEDQEFLDETDDMEDEPNPQVYPDVQIVCSAGPADYFKEELDYSNSGDGDDSMLEMDGNYWNSTDDNMENVEAMTIAEGEDVVYLAPSLALRKSYINQLLTENLKPSVFLRKLVFAVFGMKQVANSSGICGSNKPGAKPSLDRYKFEALREYTIDTYRIRENVAELEDLNRKIRTICCDARKALKRKTLKTTTTVVLGQPMKHENLTSTNTTASSSPSVSTSSMQQVLNPLHIPPPMIGHIPDLFHLASGSLNDVSGNSDDITSEAIDEEEDDNDNQQLEHIPVSVTLEEPSDDGQQ